MQVKLAQTRGFCFGVEDAIALAENTLKTRDGQVLYALGPLIHNKQACGELEKKGLRISELDQIPQGETVLVLGASGGIGLASIDIAKALGARVIACAGSDDKLAACVAHGADETINYATEDLRERIKTLTSGRGPDIVVDPVGGPYSEPALRSLAWRGRLLVIGFTAGDIPRIPLNLPLLKGCSIVGVFWGEFLRREPERFRASIAQLGVWFDEGKIRPHVSASFPRRTRAG